MSMQATDQILPDLLAVADKDKSMSDYLTLSQIHEHFIDYKRRVIFLHGSFDDKEEDNGVDWKMSNTFLKNMYVLDKTKEEITIHQHNIGGEWLSGMMIYDLIKNAQSYCSVICHGEVCSMGTIILQAADNRLAMPNCDFMFHYGSTDGEGDFRDIRNKIKFEEQQMEKMFNIYAERCQHGEFFNEKSFSQTKNWLKTKLKSGDWFLTAHEAKHYGFIDGVMFEDA